MATVLTVFSLGTRTVCAEMCLFFRFFYLFIYFLSRYGNSLENHLCEAFKHTI